MSMRRIWTIARLELVQRLRTSRWPIVLGVWFVIVGAITYFTNAALGAGTTGLRGPSLYDVITFVVLGLAMLVMPSLTATSINGDREHGVLATVQTTLVTSGELVAGKLLAGWLTGMIFLGTALPFLGWAWAAGGVPIATILASIGVLSLTLAVVCAVGLMLSTLVARPVASAVLTYLVMAALVIGTLIATVIGAALTQTTEQVRVLRIPDSFWESQLPPPGADPKTRNPPSPTTDDCREITEERSIAHTERIWWLIAPNPFVVVADAAPAEPRRTTDGFSISPMWEISRSARGLRTGSQVETRTTPSGALDECTPQFTSTTPGTESSPDSADPRDVQGAAVWPLGLATLLVLGVGSVVVAERRVRTPIHRLPSGTRIA